MTRPINVKAKGGMTAQRAEGMGQRILLYALCSNRLLKNSRNIVTVFLSAAKNLVFPNT